MVQSHVTPANRVTPECVYQLAFALQIWYYVHMKILRACSFCNKEYEAEQRYLNRGQGTFCSQSCSTRNAIALRPKPEPNVSCAHCGIRFYKNFSKQNGSKSKLYFCSREHKDIAQRLGGIKEIMPPHYGTAKTPEYRDKAFAHYPHKCANCGWNKYPDVLEVNHKNIDRSDNSITNLELLCPTCHQVFHYETKTGRYTYLGVDRMGIEPL
jgi:hypothetical protein